MLRSCLLEETVNYPVLQILTRVGDVDQELQGILIFILLLQQFIIIMYIDVEYV